MPHISYISNGFCGEARKPGDIGGVSELRFWNPTKWATTVRMRIYYSDRPPADLPPYEIGPECDPLLVFPEHYPEQFTDCGACGMKLVSDTILMVEHITNTHRAGPPDNVKYRGGVSDSLARTRLSKLWYFADGIRIIYKDPAKAFFPFNEFERYHILNPNDCDAHVTMKCVFGDGDYRDFDLTVESERVMMWDNFDTFDSTVPYGIRFISDQPVVVESERVIYGLGGLDEWGAYIHCHRPGLPAPLEWNEED